MPEASRSPGSSTRSWRGQARSRRPTTGRRWTKRVLMTLLGTALLAILGWLLWRWAFLPRIHLFALPIVHYDVLAVPPICFSSEDLAQLTAPPPEGPEVNSRNLLVGLETSKSILTLADRLQGVATRPRDNLILYLAGHGVCEGGTAYLLCSDYLREGEPGRYQLKDLLRQLSDCPAALKLLLLDVGHLPGDPRLGMVVNEFPRLLEAEVKQLDDPALWVLTANRPFETCHVSYGMKRSVFGLFVAEALRGAADRDGDRAIDLDEFFSFVRDRVAAWVSRESDGRLSQTPWLLQGRVGAADPPAHLALLPAPRRRKKAESQDDGTEPEAEEGNNAENKEGKPSNEESKGPEKTDKKNNSDAAQEPPDRQKTPSQDPARIEVRRLLQEAWALRDQMQGRTGAYAWSPVDYAPHLWRELQQLLFGYELQYRAGAAFDAGELAAHLKTDVLPLRQLIEDSSLPAGTGRSTVLFRLADARKKFLAGRPKASFEQDSTEVATVRGALQLKNDLLFRAPSYVRWHARASLGAARPVPLYEPISELLDERLPELVDLLESLEGQGPADASLGADLQSKVKRIGSTKEALEKLRQQIEKDGLEREAQKLLAESRRDPRPKGLANRIVAILNTPLPIAPMRMSLLDALQQPTPLSLEEAMAVAGGAPGVAPIATWQWERLAQRAHLEVSIARAADPDFATSLDPLIGNAGPLPTSPDAQSEQELWQGYRSLGKELQAFYEGLPGRIADGLGSSDPSRLRLSERLLRVVDARDAARVDGQACSIAVRPLPPLAPPEATIEVTGPATLRADPDRWTPLDVTVRATGALAAGTWLALEYKPDLLRLESLEGTPAPEPGQEIRIPLGPDQPCRLRYQVRAAVEVDGEVTTPLVLKVRAGKVTKPRRVEVTILPRDVVELVVQADPAIAVGRSDDPLRVRLRPFPNRPTTYRFELVNRSGRKKSATVELLALPAVPARQVWTEDLIWDSLGNLEQGVEVVAGPVTVPDLPIDREPAAIPFPGPKPAAPDGKPPPVAEKAEKEEKEAPGPETRPDVTHGMACVIRDTAGGKWVWWIELRPLAPKDYLDPQVSYNLLKRKIFIEVKARDTDDDGKPNRELLPPIGPDNPIPVAWETAGVLDPGTEMNDQGTLGPPGYVANLSAVVESAPDKEIPVRLTVDGYPRAFHYLVKCDRDRERIDRQRWISHVRMTEPQPDQAFRAPLDSLVVEFQVDAPEDAFQQPGDKVEVGIDANGDRLLQGEPRRELIRDRQAHVFLDQIAPQGMVTVDTEVGDFVVPLEPGGRKNTAVDLVARLELSNRGPGGQRVAVEDSVPVLLDGAPPEVRVEVPGRPVPLGVDVPISVETNDLSGVVKMEFGFDVNGSSDLEPDEQPKILQQKILPERGPDGWYLQSWDTALPTKDLEPGRYRLMVRATDRVNLSGKTFQEVTIAPPVKPSTTSTILGRVVFGDESVARVEVRIENTGLRAVTDQDGRFVFKDVPHGAYKLQAKGIARNRFREGSAEVKLPGPKEPAVVEIPLE